MINLYELLESANGQLFGEPSAQLFDGFCVDLDDIQPNHIFVVLSNEHGDTHQNISEAIARGVKGIICTRPPECDTQGISVLLVRDTSAALLAWSRYILGKYGTKVIAVTGFSGKSVTADAIYQILSSRYTVHMNLDAGIGRLSIPLSLARLRATHKFAVLKLNLIEQGDMGLMVEATQPEVAVLTQLGGSQITRFDSQDSLIDEMRLLVDYLSPSGLAAMNYDDEWVRKLANTTRAEVRTFGLNTFGAAMMAYNVTSHSDRTDFDLRWGSERYTGQSTPLLGAYHLYSVMAGLSVGLHFGINLQAGLEIVRNLRPLPGRMYPIRGAGGALIMNDTYSANTRSTLGDLDWLEAVKRDDQRAIFVFGDMEPPEANSSRSHEVVGERAASVADVLITRGTNAAFAARTALSKGMNPEQVHVTYADRDALSILTEHYALSDKDVVLVKGGPYSRMDTLVRALLDGNSDSDVSQLSQRQSGVVPSSAPVMPDRLSWVEIDYDAIAGNVRAIKRLVGPDVVVNAVVKSDAYGHGAVMVARTALFNGADYLGVSSIPEALELREAGIVAPILVMNFSPPHLIRQAIQHDLTLTVYDIDLMRAYDRIAREVGKRLRVHLKVDTGMGRLGALPEEAIDLVRHLLNFRYLETEGIYTHFSCADSDPEYTRLQLENFRGVIRPIQATTGFKFKYIHASNSAGTLAFPEGRFNMVRTGIAIYGMHPSDTVQLSPDFKPAITWKTTVAQVKTLPPGHPVGYGNTYVTRHSERIAVLPVGYADGLRRAPNNWGEVLIHGRRAPLIGRVSMEKTVVSVDHIPNVAIGDEVVLLGRQGQETITAEA
ncbi:MAG: alanine racemase, partial [Chloroflexota bacterium]